jgi:putative chromate ion transporter
MHSAERGYLEAESLSPALPQQGSVTEVFLTFLKLGLTSFGGPVAHIGYFRREFVERRRWLSEVIFYRSGVLVFGGVHVVLPVLQQQTVAMGWVPADEFLAGYGAAQMMPGPLFSSAGYLGWIMGGVRGHWGRALLATVAIFLPGVLLVVAALPFWQQMRRRPSIGAMLAGVNASVVALLAPTLYSPIWTSAVATGIDFAIASVGLCL